MTGLLYKIIYNPTINLFIRSVLKPFGAMLPKILKIPPAGLLKLQVDNKRFLIETNQSNFLTKIVFWNGISEFEYVPIFTSIIKRVDVFFDIGANIGFYSVLAIELNPHVELECFEPAKGPLHYLYRNLGRHKSRHARVHPVALSDTHGIIDFYEIQNTKYKDLKYNLGGEGNTGSKTTERAFSKVSVEAKMLDDYYNVGLSNKVVMFKIDTEGTEHLILEAADQFLTHVKPIIVCEILFDKIESKLNDLLLKYGYQFYYPIENRLKRVETIARNDDDGIRNCFFIHPSKLSIVSDLVDN